MQRKNTRPLRGQLIGQWPINGTIELSNYATSDACTSAFKPINPLTSGCLDAMAPAKAAAKVEP